MLATKSGLHASLHGHLITPQHNLRIEINARQIMRFKVTDLCKEEDEDASAKKMLESVVSAEMILASKLVLRRLVCVHLELVNNNNKEPRPNVKLTISVAGSLL